MIGIEATSIYLPEQRANTLARASEFNVDESFIIEKTGVTEAAVKSLDQETSDLCVEAYKALKKKTPFADDEVGCLIVCTQNPDGYGLPHTSAIVHGKLGLPTSCAAFDISLGCSGYVYSLNVIKAFMEANDIRKGVLITADPYSKVLDNNDKNTSLLFGDGASATLLSENPRWSLGKSVFGSDGTQAAGIQVDPGSQKLSMNGRAVFNFTAKVIPPVIRETVEKNDLTMGEVDLYVLHQGSRYIVNAIADRLGLPQSKVPFHAACYGNLVSSSIPAILANDIEDKHKCVLIAGFGVGLSWAASVLTKI